MPGPRWASPGSDQGADADFRARGVQGHAGLLAKYRALGRGPQHLSRRVASTPRGSSDDGDFILGVSHFPKYMSVLLVLGKFSRNFPFYAVLKFVR